MDVYSEQQLIRERRYRRAKGLSGSLHALRCRPGYRGQLLLSSRFAERDLGIHHPIDKLSAEARVPIFLRVIPV